MPPRKRAETKPDDPATLDPAVTPDEPPAPDADAAPAKSHLRNTEQPCTECYPNGWPEGAFSVGCTHGTWVNN